MPLTLEQCVQLATFKTDANQVKAEEGEEEFEFLAYSYLQGGNKLVK